MTPEQHLLRWQELHGVPASPLVRHWLRLVYVLARPLAAVRVPPAAITGSALGVTVLAVWVPHGAALVLLAGMLDGLDGAVAVLSGRVTERGALLDRLADRAGEVVFGILLVRAGAPWLLGVAVVAAVLGLEEVRRQSGRVLVVTVAERPVRVLFVAAGLATSATGWGWALLAASLMGTCQLVLTRGRIVAGP